MTYTLTIYSDCDETKTVTVHENLQLAIWTLGKELRRPPYEVLGITAQIVDSKGRVVRTW